MAVCRVALVANDPQLAKRIQESLHRQTGNAAYYAGFDEIRSHLAADSDGLLLVAVASADDARVARQLVQEIVLQKRPLVVALIDARDSGDGSLDALERHVSRRLRWPDDEAALGPIAKSCGRNREIRLAHEGSLEDWLGRRLLALTPSLLPLVDRIALAASHDVTVLLNGETGTGKTFLARLLHEYSPRRQHRFLTVPCGAVTANLIESEFFGHVKGAFTGADRAKIGKFAAVGEGTLLLDEIDTLAPEQQATLLRVIETGEFEPVGGVDTERCRARLIVASNIDLEKAVALGKFRADLYFRLNVMSFHLPPLRERVSDIAPLARGMAVRFAQKFNKELFDLAPETLAVLESFPWPGNLRQLENVVQHAVLVSSGPELLPAHLPPMVREQAKPRNGHEAGLPDTLESQRCVTERSAIERALASNGFSRTRTAEMLGISRVTLYKKMKKHGLLEELAS
jgi:DNA-binding NtrC family response regulator